MWYKEATLEDKIKSVVHRYPGNGIKLWLLDKPKKVFISFGDWANDIGKFLKELKRAVGGAYEIDYDFEVGSPLPDKRHWRKIAQGNMAPESWGYWLDPNGNLINVKNQGHEKALLALGIKTYRQAYDKGYVRLITDNQTLYVNNDGSPLYQGQIRTLKKMVKDYSFVKYVTDGLDREDGLHGGIDSFEFDKPRQFNQHLQSLLKKKASQQVSINTQYYEKSLMARLNEMIAFSQQSKADNSKFRFNWNLVESTLNKYNFGWQYMDSLKKAVESKDQYSLIEAQSFITSWMAKDKYKTPGMSMAQANQAHSEIWEAVKQIRNFANQIEETAVDYKPYDEQMAQQDLQRLTQETTKNMQNIANIVQQAISRIEGWNGTPITVMARTVDKDNYVDAGTDASIEFGSLDDQPPSFTLFEFSEKGAVIDDILEAGDDEFFPNGAIQADYFNLLKELKNPGSSSKGGRILTLYTARPIKDRSLYQDATQVPSNIFLTNSFSSAEGIARDLGGSGEIRDVWKVMIDSRYLVQTLDGMEKQYQVVGNGFVPVKRIVLESEGQPSRKSASF